MHAILVIIIFKGAMNKKDISFTPIYVFSCLTEEPIP